MWHVESANLGMEYSLKQTHIHGGGNEMRGCEVIHFCVHEAPQKELAHEHLHSNNNASYERDAMHDACVCLVKYSA
jgi:hypothetical protein